MEISPRPRTLYDKIWDQHVVEAYDDGTDLIYIDRHLVHEVTSPQAFQALSVAGRRVRRPDLTLAVPDHNIPTTARADEHGRPVGVPDAESAEQLDALARNAALHRIAYFDPWDPRQGIVHVVGPEQGFILPGSTVVCGDSHTATHGALGALAFGIGTSEIEHVLMTQTLRLRRALNMEVRVEGALGYGVAAKDVILAIIEALGSAGGTGHVIEYRGSTFENMSIEQRFTIANMSIEAGARSGLIAPDRKAFDYVKGRPLTPGGAQWDRALEYWGTLASDPGARYSRKLALDAQAIAPLVTWGTSPEDVVPVTGKVPDPSRFSDQERRTAAERALDYMGLFAGQPMQDVAIDRVFLGSCTNGRIEDLRAAAEVLKGRHVAGSVRQALAVPGSGLVKRQAEKEGLDRIFTEAGFEWREPGCSACLGMNPDRIPPGERCASTSNRNFTGRQGPGARTHLLSPQMAAAAAITGRLTDVRDLMG